MTTRRRNLIVLVAVLAISGVAAYFSAPAPRQSTATDAIPAGAFLVATLDLAGLRASPLAAEIGAFREVDEVSRRCGFDPLERAKTVAIGVPEKPDGVFGLAVTSDLGRDELARCADRVMTARGAAPRITQKDGWALLEQDEVTEALAPKGKIAYRDGEPLLIARGDYLADMQAALDGKRERAFADAEHSALRAAVLTHARSPLLLATAVLPKSLRDKLKKELEAEAEAEPGGSAAETMNAVLSVSSVALAVSAHRGSSDLDLFAELHCESAASCVTVRDFIDRKRKALARQAGVRFIGLGALLDQLALDAHGTSLDITLTAPESEMARAVRGVFSRAAPAASAPSAPSASAAVRAPDEILRAKDAGASLRR
jgi:hypothetical protein